MINKNQSNRRDYARVTVRVPVEIQADISTSPLRCATTDLSLSGCYIETIFPFPIGTSVDLKLSLDTIVLIAANVVTRDPQVGNGIRFVRMLREDRETLKAFLEVAEQAQEAGLRMVEV